MNDKLYHIYGKGECLYHSLTEEEFKNTWNQLRNIVDITKTDYSGEDLTYEEINYSMDHSGPAGGPSY